MRPLFLALLVIAPAFRPAIAAVLRPDATCSTIVDIMDGTDRQQIGYAVQFIADALVELDRPFVQKKRGSIMEPLSEDGLTGVVAIVITRCREKSANTVKDTAQGVYAGLRAMNAAVGNVK